MSDWTHGYDVSIGYTHGFYSAMAPASLDLCIGLAGYAPPRRDPAAPFRYLELGAGQGFGLCLLAAAYPQAEFVGVDFHPEHIAHADELVRDAGLTNIRFVEADFLDLAADWPAGFGKFDYVALHGIYSWVPDRVRDAVVQCLSHATRPGAAVYNAYNSHPGWLGSMPFQHIALRLKQTSPKPGAAVLDDTIGLFERLAASDAALFKVIPGLKTRIETMKGQNRTYQVQEYLNESWNLFWHSEVAAELRRAKLDYVGTATIGETQLPDLLAAPMQEIIAGQADGGLRQDLQDILINQTFRRDIFCRGPRRSTTKDFRRTTRLHLIAAPPAGEAVVVKTAFGARTIAHETCAEIFAALAAGPKSIEELALLPGVGKHGWAVLTRTLALLLQARILAVGAGQADDSASHRLNAAIARAGSRGAPYRHIAAPKLGSAVSVKDFDLLLIDSWLESSGQADAAALGKGVVQRMARMGQRIHDGDKPLKGAEAEQRIAGAVTVFLDDRLPYWRKIGALP